MMKFRLRFLSALAITMALACAFAAQLAHAQCLPSVEASVPAPRLDSGDTARIEVAFDNPCDDQLQIEVVSWIEHPDSSLSAFLEGSYVLDLAPGDNFIDAYEHQTSDSDQSGRYRIGFRLIDRFTAETLSLSMTAFSLNVHMVDFSVTPGLAIPDAGAAVTSTLDIPAIGQTVTAEFNVDIELRHTYIGDLRIELISPSGTTVVLHQRAGGSSDNLIGNYPGTLSPAGSFNALIGEPLEGTWTIRIDDLASGDVGQLVRWAIKDYGA